MQNLCPYIPSVMIAFALGAGSLMLMCDKQKNAEHIGPIRLLIVTDTQSGFLSQDWADIHSMY